MFPDLSALTFNLSLEILTGCRYSCPGCTVEKNFSPLNVSEDDADELLSLLMGLKNDGFRLLELKVAPTDIISSDNGFQALQHRLVRGAIEQYKAFNINLAMLHDGGLEELAGILDDIAPGKWLSVTIPMTLKNTGNIKFITELRERILYFKSLLKKVEFNRIYLNLNVDNINLGVLDVESYNRAHELDLGIRTVVEFPFAHSRKGLDNIIVAEELKHDLNEFLEFVKTRVNTLNFRPLLPAILEGLEFIYRDGHLYSVPVVVENFPLFINEFELSKPWTVDTVLDYKMTRYSDNLMEFIEHPECGDCCFLDQCARSDVHRIMKLVNSDKCLTNMKNRWDLHHKEE